MKNNKGITMITLIVMIIVIVLISSITIYNGLDTVEAIRKKAAQDEINAVYSALLKDDSFLNFDTNNNVILDESDYARMDLSDYYNEDSQVTVNKTQVIDNNKTIYTYVITYKNFKKNKEYSSTYGYSNVNEKQNYMVDFDTRKGVNRPIIVDGMTALMPDGVTPVEDVYLDNWYSYGNSISSFAKMEYDGNVYVWIPRYAYKIQDFYIGKGLEDVPSSAIDITFLREKTNYMSNNEPLPIGYVVHPAFSSNGIEYPGIWIQEISDGEYTHLSAPLYVDEEIFNLHLMTNQEFGAAVYLMYAFKGMNEIQFEDDEYVAASFGDRDIFNENFVTVYLENLEMSKIGDAMQETPWNRSYGEYPTADKKYVIRKISSGLFDFVNSDGTDTASYRGCITSKID